MGIDHDDQQAANRRPMPRFRVAGAVVIALGAIGGGYLVLSDDPAAEYTLDSVDETRNRPFRGVESERDRARAKEAAERLADDLAGGADDGATGARGGSGGTFLTEAGLDGALAAIRDAGGRLVSLVVTPSSVDAIVVGGDGDLRAVRVTADGADVDVQGAGPPSSVPLPRVADLDPAAPSRLARSAGADAMSATVTAVGADPRWTVTLSDGRTLTEDE